MRISLSTHAASSSRFSFIALLSLLSVTTLVNAYIPANPVNNTAALDGSDDLVHLAFSGGVYNAPISRQLWQEGFDDNGDYTNVTSVVPWTKYNKGVLIHFDESLRNQPPAAVPWIAMISCDTNGTSFSETDDIFTICRDLGAQAALLYSLHSEGCQITQEYLTTFEKVLDVFATTTLQAARIIEQQFTNVNAAAYGYNSETLNASSSIIQTLLDSNALSVNGNVPLNSSSAADSLAVSTTSIDPTAIPASTMPSVFDPNSDDRDAIGDAESFPTTSAPDGSETLPSLFSGYAIPPRFVRRQAGPTSIPSSSSSPSMSASESSLAGSATRSSVAPSATTRSTTNYLGAVMASSNLTVGAAGTGTTTGNSDPQQDRNSNTQSIAMIVLYAITGLVSLLFAVVIVSGAIRAVRHPERYGPRAGAREGGERGAGGGGGQTRAGGLTRAILDTFPVVRFGGGAAEVESRRDEETATGGGVGTKKDGEAEEEGEEVELASLPAVGMARRETQFSVGSESEVEEVGGLRDEEERRRRSTSRSSFAGAESFVSAVSSPPPLHHKTSSASLAPPILAPILPANPSPAATADLSSHPSPPHSASPTNPSTLPALAAPASASTALGSEPSAGGQDEEQSCPICFTEFESGDELRVLPCDQRHIFHTGCIDPWLLQVSSSCPLCRLDLARGHEHDTSAEPSSPTTAAATQTEETEARREEERVIRHLRALLHRSGNGNGTSAVEGGAVQVGVAGQRRREASNASEGIEGREAGMRSRFARYIAVRRRGRGRSASASEGEGALN
ncbi:hypothetical protein JCM11641_008175 [Rhodosporidiobolus odoratus]